MLEAIRVRPYIRSKSPSQCLSGRLRFVSQLVFQFASLHLEPQLAPRLLDSSLVCQLLAQLVSCLDNCRENVCSLLPCLPTCQLAPPGATAWPPAPSSSPSTYSLSGQLQFVSLFFSQFVSLSLSPLDAWQLDPQLCHLLYYYNQVCVVKILAVRTQTGLGPEFVAHAPCLVNSHENVCWDAPNCSPSSHPRANAPPGLPACVVICQLQIWNKDTLIQKHLSKTSLSEVYGCVTFYKFHLHRKLASLDLILTWRQQIEVWARLGLQCPGLWRKDCDWPGSGISNAPECDDWEWSSEMAASCSCWMDHTPTATRINSTGNIARFPACEATCRKIQRADFNAIRDGLQSTVDRLVRCRRHRRRNKRPRQEAGRPKAL